MEAKASSLKSESRIDLTERTLTASLTAEL